jgi:DNA-binding SARP family transcriptional activator
MSETPLSGLVSREAQQSAAVLHLFGTPFVSFGRRRVEVPEGSKRLLVFVALHRRPVERRLAAGVLWPSGTDTRAAGNLRSALWRLNAAGIPLLQADRFRLTLRDDVHVDVRIVNDWLARVIGGSASWEDLAVIPLGIDEVDLLPGWYDDWAVIERERVTQRVLHGLEVQSWRLVQQGRHAEAVEAAIVATEADPLRESAQQRLIEACLAEGNWSEARRRLEVYRKLVRHELGIEPSARLCTLLTQRHERELHAGALSTLMSGVRMQTSAGSP